MKKSALALIAALCVSTPAFADVCEVNSKPVADKAVSMLSKIDKLIVYCASCNKETAVYIPVVTPEVVATEDADQFSVKIGPSVVDLAYLYYEKAPGTRKWVNLGLASGCAEVADIDPLELSPEISGKALTLQPK